MSSDIITYLIVLILYLVMLIIIGLLNVKNTKSTDEFFLGGRKIGAWLTAISSTASSESGWVFLGTTGLIWEQGLSGWWFFPGCMFGYCVNWFLLAKKMRNISVKNNSLTIPDYLSFYFNDRSHLIRSFAIIIIFLSMLGYVAAQFQATGKTIISVYNTNKEYKQQVNNSTITTSEAQDKNNEKNGISNQNILIILIGAGVILLYTIFGGYFAVVWTDFIQGVIMVFALIIFPIIGLIEIGGFQGLYDSVIKDNPNFLSFSGDKIGWGLAGFIIGQFGIGLGYPGQPHVLNRYMSAENDKAISRGRIIALTWGFFVFGGAIMLGLVGRALIPSLPDKEFIFPLLSIKILNPILAAIMLSACLSAIMSTASSQLLVGTSCVIKDIFIEMFKIKVSEKKIILCSRIFIVVFGIVSIIIAIYGEKVIYWLVLFAWSGMGASFAPLIIMSTTKFKVTFHAALTSMIGGFVVTVIWHYIPALSGFIYELVPAFIFSFLSIFIISFLEKNKKIA